MEGCLNTEQLNHDKFEFVSIIPGAYGICKISNTTIKCKAEVNNKPLSLTAELKACEAKIEIEINVLGETVSHDIKGDIRIPIPKLSYKGVGLTLNVRLHRPNNDSDELILTVS